MQRSIQTHRNLLLSVSAGILLSLSWPAAGLPFLVFLALVPLFFMEDDILKNPHRYSSWAVFLNAWLAFMVFNLLTTWWILYASLAGMIVAILLNSLFMAIPWALMHLGRRVLPGRQGRLPLLIYWLTFEYLHARWELSWSWLDLGNVFATAPSWIQWYEYTGAGGGSLWVLLINLLVFLLAREFFSGQARVRKIFWHSLFLAGGLLVPVLISLSIGRSYQETIDPVEVVIIQPGQDPYRRAADYQEVQQRISQMLELAGGQITPNTLYVVAPEGASPTGMWIHEAESHPLVVAIREFQQQHPRAAWVFGSTTYQMYPDRMQAPQTAMPYRNTSQYYQAFNSAVLLAPGHPLEFYHKSKLVPGIERMPFARLLSPLGRLVEKFGGISGSLGTQPNRAVFETRQHPGVAPVICYESIYGDYMQDYFRQQASLIFIITNDGWWRNTPGHRQHNQYARLRSIEARRSTARAASTGISSFIDQKGNILDQSNWWQPAALRETLNKNQQITFFTKHGNFLGRISFFVTILLMLYLFSQGLMQKSK